MKKNALQKIIFKGNYEQAQELFFRGQAEICTNGLVFSGKISFDTYFNSFAVSQWKMFTTVNDINVSILIEGEGRINLLGSSSNGEERILSYRDYCSQLPSMIEFNDISLNSINEELIYIEIQAKKQTRIMECEYFTIELPKNCKIACGICTYKREEEVKRNLMLLEKEILDNRQSICYGNVEIFISDNAHTLSHEHENVYVFQNKNFGGAAGFTRCMIEAVFNRQKYTHVLLMDDDAIIEPFVIERMFSVLQYIREECSNKMLGGALLSKETMSIQLENGSFFTINKAIKRKKGIDLSTVKGIRKNIEYEEINYIGWFFACIPVNYITEDNLPLPLFIHGDDEEYALRSKDGVFVFNGICVWHPNPGAVLRAYMSYYDSRNRAIIASEFEQYSAFAMIKMALRYSFPQVLLYRYEAAWYSLLGFRDFYNGIEWLAHLDAEKNNNNISKLKKYNVIKKAYNDLLYDSCILNSTDRRRKQRILNWFVPCIKKEKIYNIETDSRDLDVYRTKTIRLYNENTREEYVFVKSYREVIRFLSNFLYTCMIILLKNKTIGKQWHQNIKHIQCLEFWNEYLSIGDRDNE